MMKSGEIIGNFKKAFSMHNKLYHTNNESVLNKIITHFDIKINEKRHALKLKCLLSNRFFLQKTSKVSK